MLSFMRLFSCYLAVCSIGQSVYMARCDQSVLLKSCVLLYAGGGVYGSEVFRKR